VRPGPGINGGFVHGQYHAQGLTQDLQKARRLARGGDDGRISGLRRRPSGERGREAAQDHGQILAQHHNQETGHDLPADVGHDQATTPRRRKRFIWSY
jgi:hypothetical protein